MAEIEPQSSPSAQGLMPNHPIPQPDTTQGFRDHVCGASCDVFAAPDSGLQNEGLNFSGANPVLEKGFIRTED